MSKALAQKLLEEKLQIDTKSVYEGRFISLHSDRFEDNHHRMHQYDIVTHPGAAVMIPIHSDGRIHFVKQWRRAVKEILIELPAGILEKNEAPESCAQRELQEEIGYKAKKLTDFGAILTAPGFSNERLYLFLAEDLVYAPLEGDDSDKIDHCLLSLEEALEKIEDGSIQDAKTICGIYRYYRWRKK